MENVEGVELKKNRKNKNTVVGEVVETSPENAPSIPSTENIVEQIKPEKIDGRRKPRTEKQMENMAKALEVRKSKIEEQKKRAEELKQLEQAITMKKVKQQAKKELKEEMVKKKIEAMKKQLIDSDDDEYYTKNIKKQFPTHEPTKPKQEAPSTVYMTRQQYLKSFGF
jgi:hypothetical protein